MKTNISFGECLKVLLSLLDISMIRLSKAIKVDSSLISHWVRGKRLPSSNTTYIEAIADYLAKQTRLDYQLLLIDQLLISVSGITSLQGTTKEKLYNLLIQCQNNSEHLLQDKTTKKQRLIIEHRNKEHLNIKHFDIEEQEDSEDTERVSDPFKNAISFSKNDKILLEIDDVFLASIPMIKKAASMKGYGAKIIFLADTPSISEQINLDHYNVWLNTLLSAIDNEWEVILLLKVSPHIESTSYFFIFILPLIKIGKLNIFYLHNLEAFVSKRCLCIVPNIGVLSCFPTDIEMTAKSGFYVENKNAVNIFNNFLNVLIKANAHEILKYYDKRINFSYCHDLIEHSSCRGNEYHYYYCFHTLLLPEALYVNLLQKTTLNEEQIHSSLDSYRRQSKLQKMNLHSCTCMDIYYAKYIEELFYNHLFYLNTCFGYFPVRLEKEEGACLINNIIHLLNHNKNYKIGIVFGNMDHMPDNMGENYTIKTRYAIMLDILKDCNFEKTSVLTTDTLLVKAGEDYFMRLWNQLPLVNKDNNEVITWLKSQIQ